MGNSNQKGGDALSEPLNDTVRNARHDIWLWLYLSTHENATFAPNTCNGLTMRDEIASFLKRNSHILKHIAPAKDKFLIPDESLTWIGAEERQCQWILGLIKKNTILRLPMVLAHLNIREQLIALIDTWDIDLEEKALDIESLRKEWLRHKAADSAFEWFEDKKEGAKRCACAWEWLEKNKRTLFKNPTPVSNYNELLMHFDDANLGRNEQKAIIKEIKKRWSRQQLDERNPDKKQFNVMLPITVIAQIDELANKHDRKRAEIVEILIQMEADSGSLADRLKALRNL